MLIKMWILTSHEWVNNSRTLELHEIPVSLKIFIWFCLTFACIILMHSAIINKSGRNFSTIRLFTDISCCSTIISSTILLYGLYNHRFDKIYEAYFITLCVYGIFGTIIQLCDNYITLSRYLVVYPKASFRMKLFANLYIWFLLVFTYLPYETIVPCFVNTNNTKVEYVHQITAGYIFLVAYLLYNSYFTYQFWDAIRMKNNMFSSSSSDSKLIILVYKNIAHCIISAIGVILQGMEFELGIEPGFLQRLFSFILSLFAYAFIYVYKRLLPYCFLQGCMASYFTVNIAIHFLFNYKLEKSVVFLKILKCCTCRKSAAVMMRQFSSESITTLPTSLKIFKHRNSYELAGVRTNKKIVTATDSEKKMNRTGSLGNLIPLPTTVCNINGGAADRNYSPATTSTTTQPTQLRSTKIAVRENDLEITSLVT